jgi:signal transduction histidine kinase/CheY-like chemotaxis protein
MIRFADLPIRRKLLLTTLTASATAVVFATAGFLTWDIAQLRDEIVDEVTAQAVLIAENSGTAVMFDDAEIARETLNHLSIRPRVEVACLYRAGTGMLFVSYRRSADLECPALPPGQTRLGWAVYEVTQPVVQKGSQVGTLYMRRELSDVARRLRIGLGALAALLLAAVTAAYLIAAAMQRSIVAPLLGLAGTARTISSGRDYSLRAEATSTDEVGVVVHAFNDMLDRIDERTADLSKANADLQREIEERRRIERERTAALERERDANRLKDEFLATLSHELRTPLNAVLGWTRVIRAARLDPATNERALESIERNARAQARLIEDLLEVSRIVTGKLRLQVREVDLAAIVDAAVEVTQPAAAAKRLRLHVHIDRRPALTLGDPDRLQQIVWNLLSNAVKFTPLDGEVAVRLEGDDEYQLTVRDTGAGIDPKFLPHVFEPFRQADGTASREHGGLGLGLAIAKQLVELHGGTIRVESPGRGRGATFVVSLPSVVAAAVPRDPAEAPAAPMPAPRVDPSLLQDARVLVVDDEEDARSLLEAALRQYGAHVTVAPNAAEALAAIDRQLPDVLLTDIGMPFEDGYSLLRRLRARTPLAGGLIPAVAITAYASSHDRQTADAAGFQAHIAKPFEPAEVAQVVARLWRAAQS